MSQQYTPRATRSSSWPFVLFVPATKTPPFTSFKVGSVDAVHCETYVSNSSTSAFTKSPLFTLKAVKPAGEKGGLKRVQFSVGRPTKSATKSIPGLGFRLRKTTYPIALDRA